MNVVRRDFKELKNEVPVLFVHKCHQCVLEHSLPQSESNLQALAKCLDALCTFLPHLHLVAVLQTEEQRRGEAVTSQ